MNFISFLLVFAGGGVGSMLRFALGGIQQKWIPLTLPWATLFSNCLACLVMALTFKLVPQMLHSENQRLFLFTGFCGGLSTFSTFSLESIQLFRTGHLAWALVNIFVSVSLCLLILNWGIRK